MSQKKKVTPVVAAAKPEQKRVDFKTWTVAKPKPGSYSYNTADPEDAATVLLDLRTRCDTLERLGISPRLLTGETTLTLYCWQDVR